MIKFDFSEYVDNYIDKDKYLELIDKKNSYIDKLNNSYMTGWTREISNDVVNDIKNTSQFIKNNFDSLVVIGIGGSFLGSYAFHNMFRKYFNDESFEVIYAGTTLSSKYLDELLEYLNNKNYCINVISKSGTTMETTITYNLLKNHLKRKYPEDFDNHIIVTTDKDKGILRREVEEMGYKSFEIDDDIGGRFSFMTPSHLLPLSLNYDIDKIIDGYYDGKRYIDYAYFYAVTRKLLFDKEKSVESFCAFEENFSPFLEWLKQLFGESEGKKGRGILPISMIYTRDLHSLGQFMQDGNRIIFETMIKFHNNNFIEYKGNDLNKITNSIMDSVLRAHNKGGVPGIEIEIDELNIENIASLIYFFQLSAAFSGLLFEIDPFNQPGVEVYKEEVRKVLGEL